MEYVWGQVRGLGEVLRTCCFCFPFWIDVMAGMSGDMSEGMLGDMSEGMSVGGLVDMLDHMFPDMLFLSKICRSTFSCATASASLVGPSVTSSMMISSNTSLNSSITQALFLEATLPDNGNPHESSLSSFSNGL